MMRLKYVLAAAAFALLPSAAMAKDSNACKTGMVCASNPQSVASALQEQGFTAKLGTDGVGDPKIDSAASGYNFQILFYGCEDHKLCDSMQFYISFKDDGKNTPELANRWNKKNRFAQAAAMDDGTLRVSFDVTTQGGGVSKANFADAVDWYRVMLGELSKFFKE